MNQAGVDNSEAQMREHTRYLQLQSHPAQERVIVSNFRCAPFRSCRLLILFNS